MPYCSVEQGSLYYEAKGKGNPLLLIAGLASDVQSWVTFMKEGMDLEMWYKNMFYWLIALRLP